MLFIFVGTAALLNSAPVGRSAVLTQPRAAPVTCAQPSEPLSRRAVVASAAAVLPALFAQSAVAEQTLVTRQQAYSRYVPRIERGRDYWSTAVKKAVASSDWTTLNKAIEKKGSIDRIFGPMQLWASSFSGKSISEKTIAMNAAVDELRDAVRSRALNPQHTQTTGGATHTSKLPTSTAPRPHPSPNPEQVNFLTVATVGTEKGGGFLGFGGSKKIEVSYPRPEPKPDPNPNPYPDPNPNPTPDSNPTPDPTPDPLPLTRRASGSSSPSRPTRRALRLSTSSSRSATTAWACRCVRLRLRLRAARGCRCVPRRRGTRRCGTVARSVASYLALLGRGSPPQLPHLPRPPVGSSR